MFGLSLHHLTSWPAILAALLHVIVFMVYRYLRWNYGKLEKLGIKVKKPIFCFGSVPFQYNRLQYLDDHRRLKRFGKVWGIYEGRTPQVYVADPDMIKQMLVKDFDSFHSARILNLKNPMIKDWVIQMEGDKWKKVRSAISPIFTSRRLKGMMDIMKTNSEQLVQHLKNDSVNGKNVLFIRKMFENFTIDVTAEGFFGMKVNTFKNPNNDFIVNFYKFLGKFHTSKYVLLLNSMFPFISKYLDIFDTESLDFFRRVSKDLIDARRKDGKTYDDYIDILLKMTDETHTEEMKTLGITPDTVLALGFVFFIAGYVTTRTTLTFAAYLLAANPDAQVRAFEEVREVITKHGEISHETTTHMPYLSAVIDETLRLYPASTRLERKCSKTWSHNGLTIKKGMILKIPVHAMHHNPEFFEDPEEFNPERFLKTDGGQAHHPYSYLPWSTGPRSCIGMRFAMQEMLVVLANLLNSFRFDEVPGNKPEELPAMSILSELIEVSDFKLSLELRK